MPILGFSKTWDGGFLLMRILSTVDSKHFLFFNVSRATVLSCCDVCRTQYKNPGISKNPDNGGNR